MRNRRSQTPRAAGTRGFWAVIKSFGRPPNQSRSLADIDAVGRGEARSVSCMLRGSFGTYPRRFQQGELQLRADGATWRRSWGLARASARIDDQIDSIEVRRRDPSSDWNIKSGGLYRPGGLLRASGFSVIACSTPRGRLELAVPTADVPLVESFLSRGRSRRDL
jgi:hypothetical protein